VVRLGFEVRVELLVDGHDAWAQVTRSAAVDLGLAPGVAVHVRRAEPARSITVS
jgi:sulfate transport system ATP-binding protein